jgi:hypothetical protein
LSLSAWHLPVFIVCVDGVCINGLRWCVLFCLPSNGSLTCQWYWFFLFGLPHIETFPEGYKKHTSFLFSFSETSDFLNLTSSISRNCFPLEQTDLSSHCTFRLKSSGSANVWGREGRTFCLFLWEKKKIAHLLSIPDSGRFLETLSSFLYINMHGFKDLPGETCSSGLSTGWLHFGEWHSLFSLITAIV